jgi:PIN domain nuclease of toxin-antitoxin system
VSVLLDTHILLWAAAGSERLPDAARRLIEDRSTLLLFSAASLWEIAIKSSLRRDDFQIDAKLLYRGLLDSGYVELPVTGSHAAAITSLPLIHRDPFDRILVAQAMAEHLTLVTADETVARYSAAIHLV